MAEKEQWKFLQNHSFCIYGAGIVAASVYTAIKTLFHREPLFFLCSDLPDSAQNKTGQELLEIDGIAIKYLSAWDNELCDGEGTVKRPEYYLVAAPEVHHEAIIASLRSLRGARIENSQMIPCTNEVENELMEAYYSGLMGYTTVQNLLTTDIIRAVSSSAVQVFQVKSHMDKPLREQQGVPAVRNSILPGYIIPIQAGAALTARSVADLKDNTGDNISSKNSNYCELTITYYAWKHSRVAYKGICHYRRIFDISDEQMKRLVELGDKWDVILPYPSVYYPDISREHIRYVSESDWNAMLQALRETAPEYLEVYEKGVRSGERFFNNFNMLIARQEVFDDYCRFLFRVLRRTEELTTPKGSERADRFAGYLGENLTTLYFLKNRERLRIVYAGKVWLT